MFNDLLLFLLNHRQSHNNDHHLMDRVGVLFKQFLSDCDFRLCDPCDLVPLPLNSDNNVIMIIMMIVMIIVMLMIVMMMMMMIANCVILFPFPSTLKW